jgi:hypothetical protein
LFEIKNVRGWIYPVAAELYQLLDKATTLQMHFPDLAFLPVLVCRQAHPTTNFMADHLGFSVISTKAQYVPSTFAGTSELREVVAELGYSLDPPDISAALIKHLTVTLQQVAARSAERWRISAEHLGLHFSELRREPKQDRRTALLLSLREAAVSLHGSPRRSW